MTGRRVWVTRTQPQAAETARRLAALGFEPIVAPVLEARAKNSFGLKTGWRRSVAEVRPFLPAGEAGGVGNHAQHGGGVTYARSSYPSTIESPSDGSPPHDPGSGPG